MPYHHIHHDVKSILTRLSHFYGPEEVAARSGVCSVRSIQRWRAIYHETGDVVEFPSDRVQNRAITDDDLKVRTIQMQHGKLLH